MTDQKKYSVEDVKVYWNGEEIDVTVVDIEGYKQYCDDVLLNRGKVEGRVISSVDKLKELWEEKRR